MTTYTIEEHLLTAMVFTGTTTQDTHPRDSWKRLLILVDGGMLTLTKAEELYIKQFGEAELRKRKRTAGNYTQYSVTQMNNQIKSKVSALRSFRKLAASGDKLSNAALLRLEELEREVGHLLDTLPK